jgi:type I restriction enzyme, S subunit
MAEVTFPSDWETATLGEVCFSITDGTHFTPRYTTEGIPFYSVENLTANDFINTKYISEADHQLMIKRCKPEKGDILMTRIGSIGDTKLIDWDVNASIYVSLALLKVNDVIEPAYLYAYSRSQQFVREIESRSLLNAVPKKINMGEISSVIVHFPQSREEQSEIAKALSDIDELIVATAKLLNKKERIFEGALQTKFLESSGATLTMVSEICEVVKGAAVKYDKDFIQGSFGFLNGGINFSGSTEFANDGGDTVVVSEGGNSCGFVNYIPNAFWCGGHAYRLIGFKGKQKYLYYALKKSEKEIMNLRVGSGLPNVQKKNLSDFKTPMHHSLKKQDEVVDFLDSLTSEIDNLKAELTKYKWIKQGMAQDLLTGKVRLV